MFFLMLWLYNHIVFEWDKAWVHKWGRGTGRGRNRLHVECGAQFRAGFQYPEIMIWAKVWGLTDWATRELQYFINFSIQVKSTFSYMPSLRKDFQKPELKGMKIIIFNVMLRLYVIFLLKSLANKSDYISRIITCF